MWTPTAVLVFIQICHYLCVLNLTVMSIDKNKIYRILVVFLIVCVIVLLCVIIFRRPQEVHYNNDHVNDTVVELQKRCDSLQSVIDNTQVQIEYRDSVKTVIVDHYHTVYEEIHNSESLQELDSIIRSLIQ